MSFPDYPDLNSPRAPWNQPEGCYRHGCTEAADSGGYCSTTCKDMAETGHDEDAMNDGKCVCIECNEESRSKWIAALFQKRIARFIDRQYGPSPSKESA